MSDLFRDRSCMHWWLPNDEGYPPIIRSIRKFVEERTAPAKDLPSEDLRDMKAIFSSMNLDDGTPSEPPNMSKGKGQVGDVALASGQGWASSEIAQGNMQTMGGVGDGDTYQLGFDDGQGYWGGDQGGGAFGIPKTGDYK
jgi:hypothetical protein